MRWTAQSNSLTPVFIEGLLDRVGNLALLLEVIESIHYGLNKATIEQSCIGSVGDLPSWRPPGLSHPYRKQGRAASPLLFLKLIIKN